MSFTKSFRSATGTTRSRGYSDSIPASSYLENSQSLPSSYRGMRYLENASYPNATAFKCPELSVTINSPSVRILHKPGQVSSGQALPVFGDHDHVPGSVTLDPQNCPADTGRLSISMEGVFEYISPMSTSRPGPSQITPGKHTHIFYQETAVIPLYVSSEPPSKPTLRSAIAAVRERGLRPAIKKARSMELRRDRHSSSSSASSSSSTSEDRSSSDSSRVEWAETSRSSSAITPKTFNFSFQLPKGERTDEELPPTFSVSNVISAGVRGRVYAENADVTYRIRVQWEALDGTGAHAQLEAPILFQPDSDFQSLDALSVTPEAWAEWPLSSVEGLPVECAVTMPHPATFNRRSLAPYYVVFKTTPYSRALAAEIMADATIAVSLVRRVSFTKPIAGQRVSTDLEKSAKSPPLRNATSSVELSSSFALKGKRRVASRLPIPPVPSLDTSAVASTASSSSQSQPSSPTSPLSSSESRSISAPSSPDRGAGKSADHLGRLPGRFFKRVAKSAPPALQSARTARPGLSDASGDFSDTASISSSVWRLGDKPLPTIPQGEPSPPLPPLPAIASSSVVARKQSVELSLRSPDQEWANALANESGHRTAVVTISEQRKQKLSDSRTLHTDVSVGFPKRPKARGSSPGSHPSISIASSLPDGLYRGHIPLQKGWFPSVHWRDFSIDYYLQVSVIYDNNEFKGQVPLKLN